MLCQLLFRLYIVACFLYKSKGQSAKKRSPQAPFSGNVYSIFRLVFAERDRDRHTLVSVDFSLPPPRCARHLPRQREVDSALSLTRPCQGGWLAKRDGRIVFAMRTLGSAPHRQREVDSALSLTRPCQGGWLAKRDGRVVFARCDLSVLRFVFAEGDRNRQAVTAAADGKLCRIARVVSGDKIA